MLLAVLRRFREPEAGVCAGLKPGVRDDVGLLFPVVVRGTRSLAVLG